MCYVIVKYLLLFFYSLYMYMYSEIENSENIWL